MRSGEDEAEECCWFGWFDSVANVLRMVAAARPACRYGRRRRKRREVSANRAIVVLIQPIRIYELGKGNVFGGDGRCKAVKAAGSSARNTDVA